MFEQEENCELWDQLCENNYKWNTIKRNGIGNIVDSVDIHQRIILLSKMFP